MTLREAKNMLTSCLNSEEARSIIEYVTGVDRNSQLTKSEYVLSEKELSDIKEITAKRENGYPLQYILGKWTFMDNDYFVGEGVLIPRDDTEVVVRSVIPYLKQKKSPVIIDLCSGSGIIPITLKKLFPYAEVHALELSEKAIPYLRKNIKTLCPDILLHCGDLTELYKDFADNQFDLIISNPPYIKKSDLSTLQTEVQSEPVMALDGGDDGLDFYRAIITLWTSKLKQDGMLALELGEDEFTPVKELMQQKGYKNIQGYKDLGNIYRAINGTANIK